MALTIRVPVRTVTFGILFSAVFYGPLPVQAQQLEEIVVTAQRREQSLQDVPISIQTFGGDQMDRQGFNSLNELTTYAPGLVIKDSSEEQGLLLRGAGTQGKNLGLEQGVPTFVDGIHMGRGSQVKNTFMDIERVEVLKGPQPVYFGQNAAAGALLITTRKPGDAWEGRLSAEYGNFGRSIVEGAVGGPITDTLGIRLAAKRYELQGYMRHWSTGEKFPQRVSEVLRGTVQWTPSEQFQATLKLEYANNDLGPRVTAVVLDKFADDPNLNEPERVVVTGVASTNTPPVAQDVGEVTNLGYFHGDLFLNPRLEVEASGIPLNTASSAADGLVLDFTECFKNGGLQTDPGGMQPMRPSQFDSCNMVDESGSEPLHGILDLDYTFDNGMVLNSKTGYSEIVFYNTPFNSGVGLFPTNPRARGEDFSQWSTELRLSSPLGGTFEWMGGVYYQVNDLEAWSDSWRANARRAVRSSRSHVDSEWLSGFATVTFNFLDDRASIDVGARYTDISKEARAQNGAAEWYVRDSITDEIIRLPYGLDTRNAAGAAYLAANPGIKYASVVGRTAVTTNCDTLLGSTHPAGRVSSRRCSAVENTLEDSSFDPQVVLRYRPSDSTSVYAKYATSFKSGGFDLAVSEVTSFAEDLVYGPENYEIFEIGGRGTYLGGRLSLELTAFTTDMTGVQVSHVDRILDRNVTKNVAAQSSDGIELSSRFAASDRLTLGGYFALLDATVDEFPNAVCTEDERLTGLCAEDGTADRSGAEARNAPDWQLSGNVNYELPTILSGYRSNLDVIFMATDNFTTDRSFSDVVSYDAHEDMSASLEIGPDDSNVWSLTLYARNLFAPKPSYHPELDLRGNGMLAASALQLGISNFTSYGARLSLNF